MLNRIPAWFVTTSVVFTAGIILLFVFGCITNTYSVLGPILIDGRH